MKIKENIENTLFSQGDDKKKYEDTYTGRLIDQYKAYLITVDALATRRQNTNNFFLQINTALIGVLGYITAAKDLTHGWVIFLVFPILGILICLSWYRSIKSYKKLNVVKFDIVHAIEKQLPVAIFDTEWKLLDKAHRPYNPLTRMEFNMPKILICIYLFIFLINIQLDQVVYFLQNLF